MELHPARDAVGVLRLQLQAELAVDLVQRGARVDLPDVRPLLHDLRLLVGAGEDAGAEDHLKDVVRRDDAGGAAVFVEHHRERLAALRESDEQVVERHRLGHEERVLDLAGVAGDHALDGVRRTPVDGQVAVAGGLERGGALGLGAVGVVALDVDARDHLVVGAELRKPKHPLHHLGVALRDLAALGGGLHHRDELRVGERAALTRERWGEGARGCPQRRVEREEDRAPEPEQARIGGGDLLGELERQALWGDFAEDEQEYGHRRHRQPAAAGNPVREKPVADGGDGEVDEGVADEQRREEHRLVGQAAGDARVRLRAARADARALRAGEREEHRLRAREERGEDDQDCQGKERHLSADTR